MSSYSAEERYSNDPMFRRVVDIIESWIYEMHVTPSECRDAAMLGALHWESRNLRSVVLFPEPPEQERPGVKSP